MFREHTYRFSFPVLTVILVGVTLALERIGCLFLHVRPALTLEWPVDAIQIGALTLACFSFRHFFVVQAGADGLRTTDGIGRYHEVRWDQMETVRSVLGFLWIPYGRLGSALFFPLFLDGSTEFRSYVLGHAPSANPLRAYFMRR